MALKTPLALRIDPELLAAARECARLDNRSLANFIETALRQRIAAMTPDAAACAEIAVGPTRDVPRDL